METLRWKTRIAVLWVLMAVCISAHSILVGVDPAAMKRMAEEAAVAGPGMWVFLALFWLVPLWMAFVTMTVKSSCNRWANFVLGIIFTVLNIFHFFECGVPLMKTGPLTEPTAHHILLVGSTVVATALIAWYAWKWPKQEA
jgi:hypothetical protein